MSNVTKIGIIGTGFIAQGLIRVLDNYSEFEVVSVLTRRDFKWLSNFPHKDLLTNSINEIIDKSDLIVECTGDVVYTTDNIDMILKADIPVVTMNSEFHVTTGSGFADKGYITEAKGDQPGSVAALHEEAVRMGFTPLVYGNSKGFLNHHPREEDMLYWSRKQGVSVRQTTSFTDGSKIQIEQAFTANGLDATIFCKGMLGQEVADYRDATPLLVNMAKEIGRPIVDFNVTIAAASQQPAVYIVAEHKETEKFPLAYFKLGDGPYYHLPREYHLCFLEIPNTIKRVLRTKKPLLTNSSNPEISVASIAKKSLKPGDKIEHGIGSFEVRGEAIKAIDYPGHAPIGILEHVTVKRAVEPGQILTFEDLDIPDSLALDIVKKLFPIS